MKKVSMSADIREKGKYRQQKYFAYKDVYQKNCSQEKIKMKRSGEMIGEQKISQESLPNCVPNEIN